MDRRRVDLIEARAGTRADGQIQLRGGPPSTDSLRLVCRSKDKNEPHARRWSEGKSGSPIESIMTPEEHWTGTRRGLRRPRLGPILHRVAAELPHGHQ